MGACLPFPRPIPRLWWMVVCTRTPLTVAQVWKWYNLQPAAGLCTYRPSAFPVWRSLQLMDTPNAGWMVLGESSGTHIRLNHGVHPLMTTILRLRGISITTRLQWPRATTTTIVTENHRLNFGPTVTTCPVLAPAQLPRLIPARLFSPSRGVTMHPTPGGTWKPIIIRHPSQWLTCLRTEPEHPSMALRILTAIRWGLLPQLRRIHSQHMFQLVQVSSK